MLINTNITAAIRCPSCGKIDFHLVNRFISDNNKCKIKCSCGTTLLTLYRQRHGSYLLQINCLMCEYQHTIPLRVALWKEEITYLMCPETRVELGFLGTKEMVLKSVKKQDRSIKELTEDIGFNDFFQAPNIMTEILAYIEELSKKGRLGCTCGSSNLDVDVFEDRVTLSCMECDASLDIPATQSHNVNKIKNLDDVVLIENTYFCIDDNKKMRKAKK